MKAITIHNIIDKTKYYETYVGPNHVRYKTQHSNMHTKLQNNIACNHINIIN